jgi:hypothetical protein
MRRTAFSCAVIHLKVVFARRQRSLKGKKKVLSSDTAGLFLRVA